MSALELKSIEKTFPSDQGNVSAVCDVSLKVGVGEFYSLLGPSGCGKTTTLRCIAGLEHPDSGEIWIDGQRVFSGKAGQPVPPHQRDIGMVFQSYAIWPHMNVFENVAYPLKYGAGKRMTSREISERVMEVLRLVQMDHVIKRSATQLSGGQQQRIALARALARRPKLLLLDEPLSNLDAKLREEMRVELKDLLRQLGTTAIYVTHDQLEALAMSDRIAVMLNGRIVQEGAPQAIYQQPSHPFVASFVGNINLVSGCVRGNNGRGPVVDTEVGHLRCYPSGARIGQDVNVGIRPESIFVTRTLAEAQALGYDENILSGKVTRMTFLGDFVDGEVNVGQRSLNVRMRPHDFIPVDTDVHVVMPPDLCLVI